MRLRLVALALAFLVPTAAAATQQTFELEDGAAARFPVASRITLDTRVFYAAETRGIGALTLQAGTIIVHEHRMVNVRSDATGGRITVEHRHDTWAAREAHVALVAGDAAGYMAIVAADALDAVAETAAVVEPRSPTWYGNTPMPSRESDTAFHAALDVPHLRVSSAAAWTFSGAGRLRLFGPDVAIVTPGNTSTHETGWGEEATLAGREEARWLEIEFLDGTLVTDALGDIAADSADVRWSGAATFGSGGEGRRVESEAGRAQLQAHDGPRLEARLETGAQGSAFVPRAADLPPLGTLGAILLGMALGGLATWALVRRRREARVGADECARLAAAAADEGRYQEALEWTRRARAQSPPSRRLLLDEADFSAIVGLQDEAIALLRAAPPGPDADVRIARILADDPERAPEAADALVRALRQAPEFILEVEGTPQLARMSARQDVRAALAAARAELERA